MGLVDTLLVGALFVLALVGWWLFTRSDQHVVDYSWNNQITHLSPIWCFREEIYDEKGKRLCKVGRILFWINLALGGTLIVRWILHFHG